MLPIIYPEDHRSYLKTAYEERAERRPSYSKRAFARDLQMSPSSLTDFFSGRCSLSEDRLNRLSVLLKLEPEQEKHWKDLLVRSFSKNQPDKLKAEARIKARFKSVKAQKAIDEYRITEKWECWAYLDLLDIDTQAQDDLYAAEWLNVTLEEFTEIKTSLIDVGLITKQADSTYMRSELVNVFGGEKSSNAVRTYHRRLLHKAEIALEEHPFGTRFFSSSIFTISEDKAKALFLEIEKKVYDQLVSASAEPNPDSVYCFGFQLYNLKGNFKNDET